MTTAAPSPNPNPLPRTFQERLVLAAKVQRNPIDKAEILDWMLFEAIRVYARTNRRGYEHVLRAGINGKQIPKPLASALARIINDEVRPGLSAGDRRNLERTLRAQRRGSPPDRRPPSYPMQGRMSIEARRAFGL